MSAAADTPDFAADAATHAAELRVRLELLLDGAETFLPLVTSVVREITRVDESLVRVKRRETDVRAVGTTEGMEQRHRSLQAAAQELQRQVQHVHAVARELEAEQRPFLDAVANRGRAADA